jgi:hypothetical protein
MVRKNLDKPFKDEAYLFYIRTQSVPCSKHCPSQLYKTNLLMLYKAKAAVCSDSHTKHIIAA